MILLILSGIHVIFVICVQILEFFPLGIQTANLLGAKLQYGTQAHDAPTPEN